MEVIGEAVLWRGWPRGGIEVTWAHKIWKLDQKDPGVCKFSPRSPQSLPVN